MGARSTANSSEGESAPTDAPATVAPVLTQDEQAKTDEPSEAPKPQPGSVKHIASGTFHEVDDVPTVLAAYPDQYEKVAKSAVDKDKVGWA